MIDSFQSNFKAPFIFQFNAGIHLSDYHWIPACAGMTKKPANCKLLFFYF